MDITSEKKALRAEIAEMRRGLSPQWVQQASDSIFSRLRGLELFKSCRTVMCYVDFNNEVATRKFILACLKEGRKVSVPVIVRKNEGGREMLASEIAGLDELAEGTFGVLEPRKDNIRPVNPRELDIVIVPGLAFDLRRNRLGYGAGFYDRFLFNTRKEAYKAGVAFEKQIVEKVPADDNDIPVDTVITENRMLV